MSLKQVQKGIGIESLEEDSFSSRWKGESGRQSNIDNELFSEAVEREKKRMKKVHENLSSICGKKLSKIFCGCWGVLTYILLLRKRKTNRGKLRRIFIIITGALVTGWLFMVVINVGLLYFGELNIDLKGEVEQRYVCTLQNRTVERADFELNLVAKGFFYILALFIVVTILFVLQMMCHKIELILLCLIITIGFIFGNFWHFYFVFGLVLNGLNLGTLNFTLFIGMIVFENAILKIILIVLYSLNFLIVVIYEYVAWSNKFDEALTHIGTRYEGKFRMAYIMLYFPSLLVFVALFIKDIVLRNEKKDMDKVQREFIEKYRPIDENITEILAEVNAEINDDGKKKIELKEGLPEIDCKEIKNLKYIGEGACSRIFFSQWKDKTVVHKMYRKKEFSEDVIKDFEREVELLGTISHPHIIKCYGYTITSTRVGIVLEHCSNNDLHAYMKRNPKSFEFDEKIELLRQVADAMKYLHERKICHRDLKPQNVLLTALMKVKLTDFGVSITIRKNEKKKQLTTHTGTEMYMAPEIVTSSSYTMKCDNFSFGIMIYVIMNEKFNPYGPVENVEFKVANNHKYRPKIDLSNFNEKQWWVFRLMADCWSHEPLSRPEFSEICSYMKGKKYDESFQDDDGDISIGQVGSEIEKMKRKVQMYKEQINNKFAWSDNLTKDILQKLHHNPKEEEILKEKLKRNSIFNVSKKDIEVIDVMVEGKWSSIFRGKYKGDIVALKYYVMKNVVEELTMFEREAKAYLNLRHPTINKLLGIVIGPGCVTFIMKYHENGNLKRFLKEHPNFAVKERLRILYEVSSCMEYLHENNVMHRDLKLNNILVSDDLQAMLIDFGLARKCDNLSGSWSSGDEETFRKVKTCGVGSQYFIAPEVLSTPSYTKKCDVFSFSMVMYMVLSDEYKPFGNEKNWLTKLISDNNYRPDLSKLKIQEQWILDLIKSSWVSDPTKRPSFQEICDIFKNDSNIKINVKKGVLIYIKDDTIDADDADDFELSCFTMGGLKNLVKVFTKGKKKVKTYYKEVQSSSGIKNVPITTDSEVYMLKDEDVVCVVYEKEEEG